MSKENKNIENNQEENRNKPEGNRNWWRKLLGLNKTYGLYKLNVVIVISIFIFTVFQNICYANDGKFEYLKGSYGQTAVVLNENEIFLPSYYKEVLDSKTGLHDQIPIPAQIYDLKERKFKSLNIFMNIHRHMYLAVKLNDNEVLIFGGENRTKDRAAYSPKEAEIYNIKNNTFKLVGGTNYQYYDPIYTNVVKLKDGRIFRSTAASNFEIYDPKTMKFYKAGEEIKYYKKDFFDSKGKKEKIRNSKNIYNFKVAMTLLHDGRVYIAGANYDGEPGNAEIYDPKTNTFTQVADQLYPRFCRSAVTLEDGRVLLTGGTNAYYSYILHGKKRFKPSEDGDAEIYDPKTNTYTSVGLLNVRRCYHSSILLSNEKVLIVDGAKGPGGATDRETRKAELFDPKTNKFNLISSTKLERWAFNIEKISDNKVFINSYNGWEIYEY